MRISSSSVMLASSQISVQTSTKYEHVRKWDKNSSFESQSLEINGKLEESSEKKIDIIKRAAPVLYPFDKEVTTTPVSEKRELLKKKMHEFVGGIKVQIMKDIIEAMTGKKIDLLDPGKITDSQDKEASSDSSSTEEIATESSKSSSPSIPDWGLDYYYKETNYTKEGIAFSGSGTVTTDSGEKIAFNMSLEMSREKYDELSVSIKDGAALVDPLMINLDGSGAGFFDSKFEFDLNNDGTMETISTPSSGTGFLAYDKNGNGIIDDGSELFGPSSGNGFQELAELDEDGNGWIDENDLAFTKLKFWQKDGEGNDLVSSLLEAGIGALYTKQASTQYDITSKSGAMDGAVAAQLKETGIFLKENGGGGFIQEVDLVA